MHAHIYTNKVDYNYHQKLFIQNTYEIVVILDIFCTFLTVKLSVAIKKIKIKT